MEDIVKRLEISIKMGDKSIFWPFRDLLDAITEIKKLRNENEIAKQLLQKWLSSSAGKEDIQMAIYLLKGKNHENDRR